MTPGIGRRVVHSSRMTTARIYMEKDAVVPWHSHDNEQMSHVLEGRLLFEFPDGSLEAGPGDVVEIPPDEPHRVVALENSVAMDVFAPVREDWVRGDDAYLRNPDSSDARK
ncbi:MAG: cupin domain-containing protein [Acidobacteria bacterium]|nr:cupin domain-containing protein [Acidobacteriota bacterium]